MLKRVFDIDVTTCSECGGDVRIIASIEDPVIIQKILARLDDNATSAVTELLPDCRASPNPLMGLFTMKKTNHSTDLLLPTWQR